MKKFPDMLPTVNMNNLEMAESGVRQAGARVESAENALVKEEHSYMVRQSQEAVEPALKSVLRLVGINPLNGMTLALSSRSMRISFHTGLLKTLKK